MDCSNQTKEAYDKHGKELAKQYRSGSRISASELLEIFEGCHRILEVGVGSGADLSELISAGFEVLGLEPSSSFIREANEHFPETEGRILQASLPLTDSFLESWSHSFDGIHCSAVLMHIPQAQIATVLTQFARLLTGAGKLHLIVSEDREGLDEHRRDSYGRFYEKLDVLDLIRASERVGFRLVKHENLKGVSWSRGNRWKRLVFLFDGLQHETSL